MTVGRCPSSIFCSRGTPFRVPVDVMNKKSVESTNPESITMVKITTMPRIEPLWRDLSLCLSLRLALSLLLVSPNP